MTPAALAAAAPGREAAPERRDALLDVVRGVAAVQVVLLHLASAFLPALTGALPGTAMGSWRAGPGFVPFDGYSAVHVFFALSGIVLTRTWLPASGRSARALLAGRYLRLAIPALAACLLAVLAQLILGRPNPAAGAALGSDWLRVLWDTPHGVAALLRDALLSAPLRGYAGASVFDGVPGIAGTLTPLTRAWVPMLWTLSVEFQGSILILLLCLARHRGVAWWGVTLALAATLCWRSEYAGFLVGHLLGLRPRRGPSRWLVGLAVFCTGAWIGVRAEAAVSPVILAACAMPPWAGLPCADPVQAQKAIAGVLELLGVLLAFGNAAPRWRPLLALGRWSFPLYLGHWPGIVAAGAGTYLLLQPAGEVTARCGGVLAALLWTAAAAAVLLRVDGLAIVAGRLPLPFGGGRQPATTAPPPPTA